MDKSNRNLLAALLLLLAVCSGLALCGTARAQGSSVYDRILRLHVIANSDSEEDQALKLLVKSAVVDYISPLSFGLSDREEAKEVLSGHLEEIRILSEKVLRDNGCSEPVAVSISNCYFPVKTYGDLTFPSGRYDARRIQIGNAQGKNWWCVLYPPLCFTDLTRGVVPADSKEQLKDVLTDEEYRSLQSGQPQIRFKLLDWIMGK